MTAALFHLAPGSLDAAEPGSTILLDGAEGHHAATVMRLGPGEAVQLSDTRSRRAEGVVVAVESGQLQVQILAVRTEEPPLPRLVLVQALAKDRRDLQAVESATELGVEAVIPWQAERSVVRWKPGREAKKHAEWVNTVTTAAKQTRRTAIPEVRRLHSTAQYVDAHQENRQREKELGGEVLGEQVLGEQRRRVGVVVLHEVEEVSLQTVLQQLGVLQDFGPPQGQPRVEELHLVVGPEGGISDRELQLLTATSARTARLGRHVLRSSSAGPAAIAATQLLLGRWDW